MSTIMDAPFIQYLIAASGVLVIIAMLLLRRRASNLKLRIEPVPSERIDNSLSERNEIVSEVRVRARAQSVPTPAVPTLEPSVTPARIEPTITFYPEYGASADTASGPELPVIGTAAAVVASAEAAVSSTSALTQNDLFPDVDVDASAASHSGLDESELAFDRVISIHLMARGAGIPGRLLLEHLLQYGLRYGDMAIFHRHEHPTGQGTILFSLAQAMEPGTFDIDTLSRDSVPGVSLFLGLPGYKSLVAYDLMIDTARRLAKGLNADMLDENAQVLTASKLADWRDTVVSFDNRSANA